MEQIKIEKYSSRLRIQLSVILPGLSADVYKYYNSQRIRENFAEYLLYLHQMIRASVPLMELLLCKCGSLDADTRSVLEAYLKEHIDEEKDHDLWLLDDLSLLGFGEQAILDKAPITAIRELVGAQYYLVNHYCPVALLGYIAVLEAFPIPSDRISSLVESTGIDEKAFSTLKKHSELDIEHSDEFFLTLDRLQLSSKEEEIISSNAIYTISKCKEVFDILSRE